MQVISRAEAKAQGLKRYYTGKPCKHGHIDERTLKGDCLQCDRDRANEYRTQNADVVRERKRVHYAVTRDRQLDKARKWSEQNRERHRERTAKWSRDNAHRRRQSKAARRAGVKAATPQWVDMGALNSVYAGCPDGHHVDHIVPLKNPDVCGLHVPWNLQYLTAEENLKKSNRLII